MSDFGKLIKRMGIRRKYLFLLLLRAPFDAFRTWMTANLLKSVFGFVEMQDSGSLLKLCVGYGLLCAMLFIYNGIVWSSYAAFSARAEVWLEKKLFGKILSLPLRRIESRGGGEWLTELNSDIHGAFTMMNGALNIPHLAVSVINTLLSSFLLFKSSPLLFGAAWMFLLPQLWINNKIVLGALPELKAKSQNAMAESTSSIKPLITEAETILLYDAGALMMKNCRESSRKLMEVNMKMHVRRAFSNMSMSLLGIGGYLTLLLTGYGLIEKGALAFSDVVYCFQVRGGILAGMLMFVTCLNNLKANSVCIKRIENTLEEQESKGEK